MAQGEFDFVDFNKRVQEQRDKEHTEARAGRDKLKARLDEAESQRAVLDEEIEGLSEQIDVIDKFLGEEESVAPRDSGVKRTLETIASSIDDWQFDAIAEAVREFKPRVKESSVRSALARLVRDGVLSVNGGRGDKEWSFIQKPISEKTKVAVLNTGEAKVDTVDLPPGPDKKPGGGLAAAVEKVKAEHDAQLDKTISPVSESDRKPNEIIEDLKGRIILGVSKNADGLDSKTLAWMMSETGATPEHLEFALRRLEEEGVIESATAQDEAGGSIIRKPAEPGSKEELKRTSVQGRMAFPEAEKPPHL